MEFGERIKTFRTQRGLTQDEVASRFGITAQAVSGWERGIYYPDICIVPELAALLGVSLSELFGIESDTGMQTYDIDLPMVAAQSAVGEIEDVYEELIGEDGKAGVGQYREFCRRVSVRCRDAAGKVEALEHACLLLTRDGRKDEAIRIAQLLPKEIGEPMLTGIHDGAERVERTKKEILSAVRELTGLLEGLCDCTLADGSFALTDEEKIMMTDKVTEIYDLMFEDGDLNEQALDAAMVCLRKAEVFAGKGDRNGVLSAFGDFSVYAEKYFGCPSYTRHTSAAVSGCEGKNRLILDPECKEDVKEVMRCTLGKSCFDFVREDPLFPKV